MMKLGDSGTKAVLKQVSDVRYLATNGGFLGFFRQEGRGNNIMYDGAGCCCTWEVVR